MGDATHSNVPLLAAARSSLQLVAGYVTGTPDVQWTAADWAQFPGLPQVTIDQGYQSPPVTTAIVRDYEPGAWSTAAVADLSTWTAARPTIYCDQADLPAVLGYGWKGCLWLAIVGWTPGQALPDAPGCNIVAVQNQDDVDNAYDLSVVLDPTWPRGGAMPWIVGATGVTPVYLVSGGRSHEIASAADLNTYRAAGVTEITVSAAELTALLADFPPGNPPVTVTVT